MRVIKLFGSKIFLNHTFTLARVLIKCDARVDSTKKLYEYYVGSRRRKGEEKAGFYWGKNTRLKSNTGNYGRTSILLLALYLSHV